MAKAPPTASELRKAAEVADQEIDAAVKAVLADLATDAYPLAKSWTLDLVETLRTNTCAAEALTTDRPAWKRSMVRAATLLAHQVHGFITAERRTSESNKRLSSCLCLPPSRRVQAEWNDAFDANFTEIDAERSEGLRTECILAESWPRMAISK